MDNMVFDSSGYCNEDILAQWIFDFDIWSAGAHMISKVLACLVQQWKIQQYWRLICVWLICFVSSRLKLKWNETFKINHSFPPQHEFKVHGYSDHIVISFTTSSIQHVHFAKWLMPTRPCKEFIHIACYTFIVKYECCTSFCFSFTRSSSKHPFGPFLDKLCLLSVHT